MAKVLIAEPLADAGVELLASAHEVDARTAMTREELLAAIGGVDVLAVDEKLIGLHLTLPGLFFGREYRPL